MATARKTGGTPAQNRQRKLKELRAAGRGGSNAAIALRGPQKGKATARKGGTGSKGEG